jgi:hypothetical protein
VLAAALAGLAGCGGGPQFAEVEGKVTPNGKPLDKIRVEFNPTGSGPRSVALTDAAGKFVLKADDGSRDGAVVGSHKVVLRDMGAFPDQLPKRAELEQDFAKGKKLQIRIKKEYADAATTPLTKSVAAGQKNTVDIDLP